MQRHRSDAASTSAKTGPDPWFSHDFSVPSLHSCSACLQGFFRRCSKPCPCALGEQHCLQRASLWRASHWPRSVVDAAPGHRERICRPRVAASMQESRHSADLNAERWRTRQCRADRGRDNRTSEEKQKDDALGRQSEAQNKKAIGVKEKKQMRCAWYQGAGAQEGPTRSCEGTRSLF